MDDRDLLLQIYQKVTRLEEKLEGYPNLKDKVDKVCERVITIDTELSLFRKLFWIISTAVIANLLGIVFILIEKALA